VREESEHQNTYYHNGLINLHHLLNIMELPTLDHSGATTAAVVVPPCGNGQTLNDAADDAFERRVRASRMINAALFLVASAVIVGVIFLGTPSYGVFGNEKELILNWSFSPNTQFQHSKSTWDTNEQNCKFVNGDK